MHFVYCIGKEEDLVYPYDNCYIGVTSRLKWRWNAHTKSKYTVGEYIRKNGLTFEDNMRVIYFGDTDDCFGIEEDYRPRFYMGLNIAPGGCGGDVSQSKTRGAKISAHLKGRKKTPEHIENMKKSKEGYYKGKHNPNSKQRFLISPCGERIDVTGRFNKICEEYGLIWTVLYKNIGGTVPPVKSGTYGGFRAKSEEHMQMRHNTTGWSLMEDKDHVGEV